MDGLTPIKTRLDLVDEVCLALSSFLWRTLSDLPY